MRKILAGAVIVLVLQILAVSALVYSGAYDVSATRPYRGAGAFVVRLAQTRSVERRAASVPTRVSVADAIPARGAVVYRNLCSGCHAAPGVARSEIGSGLTPRPVDLADVAPRWSDRELFWIVKNGMRLAGMPAFGALHDDDELWDVVAFVRALPTLSARDYARLAEIDARDAVSASARPESPGSPARTTDATDRPAMVDAVAPQD
jgi:mono/diheme cytochrome c family protein